MAPPHSTANLNGVNDHQVVDPQAVDLSAIDYAITEIEGSGEAFLNPPDSLLGSSSSSRPSSPDHHEAGHLPIGPNLYKLLVNGDKDKLLAYEQQWQNSQNGNSTKWELMSAEDGNTVLHIAAGAGQEQLITEFLLPRCKGLAEKKNFKGDLPVHSAAKAGHLGALKALTSLESCPQSEGIGRELLGLGNIEGDTPLHIAVENNEEEMARHLMDEYGEACYQLNWKQVCPLYLAIEAGYQDLVEHMVTFTLHQNLATGVDGKSIVHAAIASRKLAILKMILANHRYLIESFDEGGRTPLSYAAFKGYREVVDYLLDEFSNDYAFKCDEDGSFPIHSAASGGHTKIIIKLFNTKKLPNRKGQNILHVAAGNGKSEVVSYLLKEPEFEKLINSKDDDGNTPLHLATKGYHPRVVYLLTWDKRVKTESKNRDGLTALDLVEIHAGPSQPFEARLTWMALRYVDAPRSSQSIRRSYFRKEKLKMEKQIMKPNEKTNLENYRDRVETQLLIATLVATVTFAAGFTLPGGYFQSDSHIGMAVLAHKWAFQLFVFCDTVAMYSSIISVVILIWAQLGDLKLVLVSFKFALALLGLSLAMMSVAFMMGVFVMLRNTLWLSYVVLVTGSMFSVVVLLIFIPLYSPSYIRNPVLRFIFRGIFLLPLLVCEKSQIKHS